MAKRKVIVELKHNKELAEAAFSPSLSVDTELDVGAVPKIAGVTFDKSFAPTSIPGMTARTMSDVPYVSGMRFDLSFEAVDSTYVVRAEVEEAKLDDLAKNAAVVGVFADVEIQPTIICPGSPPMGADLDVARLLCAPQMHQIGMDGSGVLVAIVDTGLNLPHLAAHGKNITLDAARSWVPNAGMVPGNAPVGHGTMCAYDAAIVAPRATFLDIQVLRSTATGPTVISGVLSDAVRAYAHLCRVMSAPRRPGELRSMVVSNSWGMFHPSWDFPVGDTRNYSDNPNHPFNRIVGVLEQLGADILFAAGNCGRDCPDGRCGGVTTNAIYGANGHPAVLTIAGVDITKTRVGYSTQGPGRLSRNKPDLCGFTHFRGSGVYAADGGTSAATPVVAGVVAAVRSKRPFVPGNPSATSLAIRNLMRSTAEDRGAVGFDLDYGYGVVGGCALYRRFAPFRPPNICVRFPWLCRPRPVPNDICLRFPEICRGIPRPPFPPIPDPGPGPTPQQNSAETFDESDIENDAGPLLEAWQSGYHEGQRSVAQAVAPASSGGCGCSKSK